MADLLGPSGKQIPDHSLELNDLPLASGANYTIVTGSDGAANWVSLSSMGFAYATHTHSGGDIIGAVANATTAANATTHIANTSNPHGVTIGQIGAAAASHSHQYPHDVAGCALGKPAASTVIWLFVASRSFNIAAQSGTTPSRASARTAATASTAFTLWKNGVSFGTFTFGAGGTVATWSISATSVVSGDILHVSSPAQDSTLADIAWVLEGLLV